MKKAVFGSMREDRDYQIEDLDALKEKIIDDFEGYWGEGADGSIDLWEGDKEIAYLLLEPNQKHGLYISINYYIDERHNTRSYLSLYDESKLHEVVETVEEIYVSAGLFLPPELAWEGIKCFIETGELSPKIRWVSPDFIPEDGNWA